MHKWFSGLTTSFSTLTLHPSILESPEYLINEPSACVYAEYLGDVSKMTWKAIYHNQSEDIILEDRYFVSSSSWKSSAVLTFLCIMQYMSVSYPHIRFFI